MPTDMPKSNLNNHPNHSQSLKPPYIPKPYPQVVDVPGWVFKVDVPDLFYTGKVLGPDHSHSHCVEFKLQGNRTM